MTPKLLRITTVPISLHKLLQGQANFMQKNGFEVLLASAKGKEIEQIEKETGLNVKTLSFTRKISPFTDLSALWQTYRFIKKEKPTIVHTHTPKAGIVGMLAAKLAGVPIRLHTVAGMPLMEAKGIKRKILNFVEKLTYKAATKVYPNSYGLQEIIVQNHLAKPEKLKVIANGSSNGINTRYFSTSHFTEAEQKELKAQLNISPDDFVFIFVGRLVGDKGINEMVEAFKNLQKKQPNIKLLLVGNEEPELDPLQKETQKEIRQNQNIITTGWVEDVRPYFAIANALVFPSYREGLPNVVLQAGAMELPSIVTDINGCNEIITHQYNGLIIPAKNTIELQKAMEKILTDKGLYIQMKKNARPIIVDKYKQEVVWEALLEEYRRLLEEKGVK